MCYSDEVVTQRYEKISATPKGYGQFHLTRCCSRLAEAFGEAQVGLGVSRDTPSSSLRVSDEIGQYRDRRSFRDGFKMPPSFFIYAS